MVNSWKAFAVKQYIVGEGTQLRQCVVGEGAQWGCAFSKSTNISEKTPWNCMNLIVLSCVSKMCSVRLGVIGWQELSETAQLHLVLPSLSFMTQNLLLQTGITIYASSMTCGPGLLSTYFTWDYT